VEGDISEGLINKIKSIEGIIAVRVL